MRPDVVTLLASADSESGSGGSALFSLGFFILIPVAMYFLLIRPQRKRQREQAAQQASLEVGDEIMTTSGVYGFITGFDGDIVWVEVDDNVQLRMARAAIQRRVDTSGSAAPTGSTGAATSDVERSTSIADTTDDTRDQ